MKTAIYAMIALFSALALGRAAESEFDPLKPGEAKAWETPNEHKGKTLYRRWAIDSKTMSEERIVMNADSTVRGRVITTYQSGKQSVVIAYKGMTEPWFTEQWSWGVKGGYSVERRSIGGGVIVRQIFPADDKGLVHTLDSTGKEIAAERYKELSEEVADLLF